MRRQDYPLWLDLGQAAEMLGLSYYTVREYCIEGKIPSIRIGNRIKVDRDGLFWQARKGVIKFKQEKEGV